MGKKLALLIGNSDYEDVAFSRLRKPVDDVERLTQVLADPEIGNFEIDPSGPLINKHDGSIRIAIEAFFNRKKSDDLLLLYFAGHGFLDEQGRLHLAVANTKRESPKATAIPASFIAEAMYESDSRRQVLILDCCHSGAFVRGSRAVVGASVGTESIFNKARMGYGRVIITATDATQYALENMLGSHDDYSANSIFTRFLLEGLQTGNADRDGDNEITHDELFDYVRDKVVESTTIQTPKMWVFEYDGKLSIARRRVLSPNSIHSTSPQSWSNRENSTIQLPDYHLQLSKDHETSDIEHKSNLSPLQAFSYAKEIASKQLKTPKLVSLFATEQILYATSTDQLYYVVPSWLYIFKSPQNDQYLEVVVQSQKDPDDGINKIQGHCKNKSTPDNSDYLATLGEINNWIVDSSGAERLALRNGGVPAGGMFRLDMRYVDNSAHPVWIIPYGYKDGIIRGIMADTEEIVYPSLTDQNSWSKKAPSLEHLQKIIDK